MCPTFLKFCLASVVASKIGLVPFAFAEIFQAASLIFQGNSLIHQCFEIWESVHNQLASKRGCQAFQEFFHLLALGHALFVGVARQQSELAVVFSHCHGPLLEVIKFSLLDLHNTFRNVCPTKTFFEFLPGYFIFVGVHV